MVSTSTDADKWRELCEENQTWGKLFSKCSFFCIYAMHIGGARGAGGGGGGVRVGGRGGEGRKSEEIEVEDEGNSKWHVR